MKSAGNAVAPTFVSVTLEVYGPVPKSTAETSALSACSGGTDTVVVVVVAGSVPPTPRRVTELSVVYGPIRFSAAS